MPKSNRIVSLHALNAYKYSFHSIYNEKFHENEKKISTDWPPCSLFHLELDSVDLDLDLCCSWMNSMGNNSLDIAQNPQSLIPSP